MDKLQVCHEMQNNDTNLANEPPQPYLHEHNVGYSNLAPLNFNLSDGNKARIQNFRKKLVMQILAI
jgi:hypothetical protein